MLMLAAAALAAAHPPAADAEPHDHAPRIVTPDQRRHVAYPGHQVHVLTEPTDLESGLYLQHEIVSPRSMGAPPHMHGDEDEVFIVMEGEISFLNGEDVVVAGPGTVAILPRGHWHGFWNHTDEPTTLMLAVSPGDFGNFFDEVVADIRAANADNPDAIGGIIAAAAARRNVTVDMSRLPPEAAAALGM